MRGVDRQVSFALHFHVGFKGGYEIHRRMTMCQGALCGSGGQQSGSSFFDFFYHKVPKSEISNDLMGQTDLLPRVLHTFNVKGELKRPFSSRKVSKSPSVEQRSSPFNVCGVRIRAEGFRPRNSRRSGGRHARRM